MFDEMGFEILEQLISRDEADDLLNRLAKQKLAPLRGGIRHIDKLVPAVGQLANSIRLLSTAQHYLPGPPSLVRAIYFDKSSNNNWYVAWHQDRTVSVSNKFELSGWGPWSVKAGVLHVQPPLEVLSQMATIRIHLDPAHASNGCLKIIPKSHQLGLLHTSAVSAQVQQAEAIFCAVPKGGALVMRPHILHASEKMVDPSPRRVLHFEYSSFTLPLGIAWNG